MRRFCKYLGITFLALFASLAVFLWIGADRLVDERLRPWAAAQVATALDAEVHIDRLALGWRWAELSGVQVARPGEFRLQVEAIAVRYTLAGLWSHRLESVTVRRPDAEWHVSAAAEEPVQWPPQPPLRVAGWRVEDGRLLLHSGEDSLLFRQLEVRGATDSRYGIDASAVLGKEAGVPLSVSGYGQWEKQPELTITDFRLSGQPLLQEPVTLAPGVESFGITLALAQLDDAEASRLLAALDRQPPWPPALGWQLTAPRLTLGLDGEELSLRLETASGEVRFEGKRWPWETLRVQLAESAGSWVVEGEVALPAQARLQLQGAWRDEHFKGPWRFTAPSPAQLSKTFGFDFPPPAERLRNLVLSGELQASVESVGASRTRLSVRFEDGYELTGAFSGRWQKGATSVEATELVLRQGATLLAKASLKLARQTAGANWRGNWRLEVPEARSLAQALTVDMSDDLPSLQTLELQGELATTADLLLLPAVQLTGRLTGSGLDGRISGRLSARQLTDGWRIEVARLAATDLEYMSPDGVSGLTGGTLRLAGSLTLQEDLSFALRGEAAAGEALSGRWYADLGGLPLGLDLAGTWESAKESVRLRNVQLDLAGVATARLQGRLSGERIELDGDLAVPRLDGPFLDHLRRLTAGVFPEVDQLKLTGGLHAVFTSQWQPAGWEILVLAQPAAIGVTWGEAFRLTRLTGELPLLLQRGALPPVGERLATLQWGELHAGPLRSNDERLQLAAGPNRWRLVESLQLPVGGGSLEIPGFILSLPATGPEVQAALRVSGVDLAELSRAFEWPEMGGKLAAELPDIRFANEEIRTGGEARLQVFNGAVRLRNMLVRNPFSSYPTYHADIDFSSIDLQLLTQAFAFGEMNGVADGFVHDLRLFGTVPSAFEASFATREKGKRNISVKALRNLNTLSQGGLSAALSQGIYRFIDFYRYRKIGIRCSLRNDVFHLQGTARPGTDTYLIYGGWLPPRIDVIVSTPTISFREMVKRIKRIERAGR